MSRVVYTVQNPNDPNAIYALWDTGRIDPLGLNPPLPVTDGPQFYADPVPPARALIITDWDEPSGYVFTHEGLFYPFGSAPELGPGNVAAGVPYGVGQYRYIDVSMDPDGTGFGLALDVYGKLYNFGGLTAPDRPGPFWTSPIGRRLEVQWPGPFMRTVIMDCYGGRNQDYPSTAFGQTDGYYDETRDWARDIKITDWGDFSGDAPSGYMLLASGLVISWGPNAPDATFGNPVVGNRGTQVGLEIISLVDPLTLAQIGNLGQFSQYEVSTPPTVFAGGETGTPAAVETDTTRPTLAWSYSDPQSDSQAAWQLLVYSQDFVDAHDLEFPRVWRDEATVNEEGTDRTIRGIQSPVDLANGDWVMYVRAQDTSGLWSDWDSLSWQQNVPLPTQPDSLLATVDEFHVNLALTTDSPDPDLFAIFEYQDEDDETTWTPVRTAEEVVFEELTLAVDWDVRFGVARTYRARTFKEAPRVTSLPSPEQTVMLDWYTFALTSTVDPELGGEIWPGGSMGWTREITAGVFEPLNSHYPIVVGGGVPKAQKRSLTLDSADHEHWNMILALVESEDTLLLREPFGEATYCRVVGSFNRDQVRVLARPDEGPRLGHVHEVTLPLVEVARPLQAVAEDPDA